MGGQKKKMAMGILALLLSLTFVLAGCGLVSGNEQNAEEMGSVQEISDEQPGEQQQIEQDMLQAGEPNRSTGLSVVLVNDTSGSMKYSDPERIAIEAAKMFIDMTKDSDSRIALVEFDADAVLDGDLTIQNRGQKRILKTALDEIAYEGAITNTGAAMGQASDIMRQMTEQAPGNQKAVILFTDGNTDMGDSSERLAESLQRERTAIQELADMGCPVYPVGLNCNGNVDVDKLSAYAELTGGEVLITGDASELPAFFNEIFKKLGNIDDIKTEYFQSEGEFQTVTFDITNNNIKEANLLLLSDQRIQDIRLYAPDGTQKSLDQDNCYSTNSNKYSMIKMINPPKESWRLEFLGAKGDSIWFSVLYNYDINMVGTLNRRQLYRDEDVSAEIYLTSDGQRITETEFYAEMSAWVEITEDTTGEKLKTALAPGNDGMKGSFRLENIGEYSVVFHIDGQGLYRDSEPLRLEVKNRPVVQLKSLPELQIKKGEELQIDLGEYFADPDGDTVSYECEAQNPDIAEVSLQNNLLKIEGTGSGQARIRLLATDGYGESAEAFLDGTVKTFFEQWRMVIAAGLLILLLLVLILAVRFHPRAPKGYLLISLVHKAPGTSGKVDGNQYKLANGFSMKSLGKRVNLAQVMGRFAASYRTMAAPAKAGELDRLLASVSQEMKMAQIHPTTDAFRIAVKVSGGKTSLSNAAGNPVSQKKKLVQCMSGKNSGFHIVIRKDLQAKECVVFSIYYSRDLC